jgi:hypothetical protein
MDEYRLFGGLVTVVDKKTDVLAQAEAAIAAAPEKV